LEDTRPPSTTIDTLLHHHPTLPVPERPLGCLKQALCIREAAQLTGAACKRYLAEGRGWLAMTRRLRARKNVQCALKRSQTNTLGLQNDTNKERAAKRARSRDEKCFLAATSTYSASQPGRTHRERATRTGTEWHFGYSNFSNESAVARLLGNGRASLPRPPRTPVRFQQRSHICVPHTAGRSNGSSSGSNGSTKQERDCANRGGCHGSNVWYIVEPASREHYSYVALETTLDRTRVVEG